MSRNEEPGFSEPSPHWRMLKQDYILARIISSEDLARAKEEITEEIRVGEYVHDELILASEAVAGTRFIPPKDTGTTFHYIKRTEAERGDPPIFWPNREYLGEDGENHQINSIIGGSCFLVGDF